MTTFPDINAAYLHLLRDVWFDPQFRPSPHKTTDSPGYIPNGGETRERLNYQVTIRRPDVPGFVTASEARNKLMNAFMAREIELFDKGEIRVDEMKRHSKLWERIANPDGTINANYGHMAMHLNDAGNIAYNPDQGFITQWAWAKARLKEDPDTRQAYLHFNRPKDQWEGNRDQPCTMFVQFIMRENRLHMASYMRSNDLVYGTPYNLGYFAHMMDLMVAELRPSYPHAEKGDLTHTVTSLHIYERHRDKVEAMLGLKVGKCT